MNPRHLLITATSGLALLVLAEVAAALSVTIDPATAASGFIPVLIGVNLTAWVCGWIVRRRGSRHGFAGLLIAVGDSMMPVSVYLIVFVHLPIIAGHIAPCATFAAMAGMVYIIFVDLAERRLPLMGRNHRAYLFAVCLAVPVYFSSATAGVPIHTVVLLLVAVVGVMTLLSRLLEQPWRKHYGAASMILVFAFAGLLSRTFALQPSGWMVAGMVVGSILLFAVTWLNREVEEGKLLGFGAWAGVTLAFVAGLAWTRTWGPISWLASSLWVGLLVYVWSLLGPKRFAALKEPAFWFVMIWGVAVAILMSPVWRRLAMLHFTGLRDPFPETFSFAVDLGPGNWALGLSLGVIAVALSAGIILRRATRVSAAGEDPGENLTETVVGVIPLLLFLAAVSTGSTYAFGSLSWIVASLVLMGTACSWAAEQFRKQYPSRSLSVCGYAAFLLAVLTATTNLTATLLALAAVVVILFVVSEWNRSLVAYISCLVYLCAGVMLLAFKMFPQQSMLTLGLCYPFLLGVGYWWVSRARTGAHRPTFGLEISGLDTVERERHGGLSAMETTAAAKALITLTGAFLLAAFIIGSGIRQRQFHPISLLLVSATYMLIRFAWEPVWTGPARRYARALWVAGSAVAHLAAGFLLAGLLLLFNAPQSYYGLAYAGLAGLYLIIYLVDAPNPPLLTRLSVLLFIHVYSLSAVAMTVGLGSLGLKTILVWLLVIGVHSILATDEKGRKYYPVWIMKPLGYAGIALSTVYLVWVGIQAITHEVPQPDLGMGETWLLARIGLLFLAGLVFTVRANQEGSQTLGILAVIFIFIPLALIAWPGAPELAWVLASVLYLHLLVQSRIMFSRVHGRYFAPGLAGMNLQMANILLMVMLGFGGVTRVLDAKALLVAAVGFIAVTYDWEKGWPVYVRERFGGLLLLTYAVGYLTAAVAAYSLLLAYGIPLSAFGLSFAVLAGLHVCAIWLARLRKDAPIREKVLRVYAALFALLGVALTLAYGRHHIEGAMAAVILILIGLVAYLMVPADRGRGRALAKGFTALLFLILVAVPAGIYLATGALTYLMIAGLATVAAIHVFAVSRVHEIWIYLSGAVLVTQGLYVITTGRVNLPAIGTLTLIGLLLIGDSWFLAAHGEAGNTALLNQQPPENADSGPGAEDPSPEAP